jgi:hypothetical protein
MTLSVRVFDEDGVPCCEALYLATTIWINWSVVVPMAETIATTR